MTEGTHRCTVDGCPNIAAYEVVHYAFDLGEGAVVFRADTSCPFICVEHALENERTAAGVRTPSGIVEYRYTNRERAPGLSIYRQLEPAYVA
jgi:hypothetical protein